MKMIKFNHINFAIFIILLLSNYEYICFKRLKYQLLCKKKNKFIYLVSYMCLYQIIDKFQKNIELSTTYFIICKIEYYCKFYCILGNFDFRPFLKILKFFSKFSPKWASVGGAENT